MKYARRIAATFGIIFIIVMGMNFRTIDRVWIKWLKGSGQTYYGNINLWHIDDEFSLKIPYSTMLKKYEKDNFGVFINVSYMTAQEAREKIAAEDYPDLVTYSKSFFENPENELISLDEMENPILNAGKFGKNIFAYPIYYDTYSLIINEELISETDEDIPTLMDLDYIMNTLIKLQYKEDTLPLGFTGYGAAANLLDAVGSGDYDIPYNEAKLNDFEKGKVAVLVCSSLELEKYTGELPSYSVFQFSGFTDRVRYLSVYGGKEDKNRLQCSKEIAAMLMEDKLQKQIGEYAFSPLHGYSAVKSEKVVRPLKVFYNQINKETVINALINDKMELLKQIQETLL